MRVLAAPDKFRGTATGPEVAAAIAKAAIATGWSCVQLPLADGGEGMLEAMGGGNRRTTVSGPSGLPTEVEWCLDEEGTAVIESSLACGLLMAGGPEANDPWSATSRGVGELIVAAARAGARSVILGVGGSATTDGGAGAVAAIDEAGVDLRSGVRVNVCCDVTTRFTDAARVFGPQKGADGSVLDLLGERLRRLRAEVLRDSGLDLDLLAGSGAAGGLAGGLAALGARLVPGFDAIAEARGFDALLAEADLVVTGEGHLDATSLTGKVVGGVAARALAAGVGLVVVVGSADDGVEVDGAGCILDLSARFGAERSRGQTLECIEAAVSEALALAGQRKISP